MNKENKITGNNLLYALLFLVVGIVILTEDVIDIASKLLGIVLIVIGLCKSIKYIYMKGKLGSYPFKELVVGLLVLFIGTAFIALASTFSFAIRIVIGCFIAYSGINRMVFAISTKSTDNTGFIVYFITSICMLILGVLIISGVVDKIIGILIIIYSVVEIVNYIYFKVKTKDYEPVSKNDVKKTKQLKNTKVVDAVIEEDEK